MQPIIIHSLDSRTTFTLNLAKPETHNIKSITIKELNVKDFTVYIYEDKRRDFNLSENTKIYKDPGKDEIDLCLEYCAKKTEIKYELKLNYTTTDQKDGDDPHTHKIVLYVIDKIELNLMPKVYANDVDETIAKHHWEWGENHKGGIIMADIDNDPDDFDFSRKEDQGHSELVELSTLLCDNYPKHPQIEKYYKLALTTTANNAIHFGLYTQATTHNKPELILGSDSNHTLLNYTLPTDSEPPKEEGNGSDIVEKGNEASITEEDNGTIKQSKSVIIESRPLEPKEGKFFIRVHSLPNEFFEGIITISFHLFENSYQKTKKETTQQRGKEKTRNKEKLKKSIRQDHVIFRVAPWMMLPHTQEVEKVFVSKLNNPYESKEKAEELSLKFNEKLTEIFIEEGIFKKNDSEEEKQKFFEEVENEENRGDRWIQDEIEFGYCQGVTHGVKVVCDSPRDSGLDVFAKNQKRADIGHFQIEGNHYDSLNSFGNLEVSPPVEPNYPFGRIIIGGSPRYGFGNTPRHMAHQLRGFLHAQKVQPPIEIFTDWLTVGHVDEIINFIPIPNAKPEDKIKFKMLIASPQIALDLLVKAVHTDINHTFYTPNSEDKNNYNKNNPEYPHLDNEVRHEKEYKKQDLSTVVRQWITKYWDINKECQEFLDWNRELLKKELGIDEEHIIDVPTLFKPYIFREKTNEETPNKTKSYNSKNIEGKTEKEEPDKEKLRVISILPNLVNQLVIKTKSRSFSIAPKCYGPVNTEEPYTKNSHICEKIEILEEQIQKADKVIKALGNAGNKPSLPQEKKVLFNKLRAQIEKTIKHEKEKEIPMLLEELCYLFEQYLIDKMPKDHKIYFVNDWKLHFIGNGGVHCTTNVQRKPFDKKWWTYKPPNAHDI